MAAPQHFGVHDVSGSTLIPAIILCNAAVSGCRLVPVSNGLQIAVIGTGWES